MPDARGVNREKLPRAGLIVVIVLVVIIIIRYCYAVLKDTVPDRPHR